MATIKDFRQHAINLAAQINAQAAVAGLKQPIYLHTDEFVHLHCGDMLFLVFRDVIVAGSMYFECALFGFFKETYRQEIFFDDIDSDALYLYLNIAHAWFFEIKVRGTKPVQASIFKALIEAVEERPMQGEHLQIPQQKLKMMAKTVVLADRFVHRPLLSILRLLFISLLNFTHDCWFGLKAEERKWDAPYHQDFMSDYMAAFDLLSTGHDDEKMLRDAITESFYWFSLDNPSFTKYYRPIMSRQFIAEWKFDRKTRDATRFSNYAMGIFRTDQMMYAVKTRQQKDRRFKRVMNLCSPETRRQWLPWFNDAEEKRARNYRLCQVVETLQRRRLCESNFIPGAPNHGESPSQVMTQTFDRTNGGNEREKKKKPRQKRAKNRKSPGRQNSRGDHQDHQDRDQCDHACNSNHTTSHGGNIQFGQGQKATNLAVGSFISAVRDLVNDEDITKPTVERPTRGSGESQARTAVPGHGKINESKGNNGNWYWKKKYKVKKHETALNGNSDNIHDQTPTRAGAKLTSQPRVSYSVYRTDFDLDVPAHESDDGPTPIAARDPKTTARRGRNSGGSRGGGKDRGEGRGGA